MSHDRDNPGSQETGDDEARSRPLSFGEDGDLDAWRTEHPDRESELADLRRLRELYQSMPAPEPNDDAWDTVQARLQDCLGRSHSPRPLWAILGSIAAALILGLLLARGLWTTRGPAPAQGVAEPFPVAESADVTIVSMDARDVSALVVGELPISGDLEFARPEDVRVIRCERCPYSGRMARLEQGDEVPMFVTAAAESPNHD